MQTLFKKKGGSKEFAPAYFVVVYNKNKNEPVKYPFGSSSLDHVFDEYPKAVKVELYKNGTHNLSPVLVDQRFCENV